MCAALIGDFASIGLIVFCCMYKPYGSSKFLCWALFLEFLMLDQRHDRSGERTARYWTTYWLHDCRGPVLAFTHLLDNVDSLKK